MIPKGSQRSGGQQLATHLLNEFDNDRVEIAEVRGAVAQDLHGAFAEWSATATGTRCKKYLYSLSVNPDPQQGPLTREQYIDFVNRAEDKLGLSGQPRAVVFHVKYGREHCHAVWSRIDTEKMRAVQLSHDRHSLRSVVIEFARDQGLALPRGVTRDRTKSRERGPRPETLADKQMEERTGLTRDQRMKAVTDAWNQSRDALGLVGELEKRGFLLARGDRRAYVIVDRFGEIHSLARQIQGVRAKDVKARLAEFPVERLPDAKKAQGFARDQRESVKKTLPAERETAKERREGLAAAHAKRRAAVEERWKVLDGQHRLERDALTDAQDSEKKGVASERLRGRPKGVLLFLARITGIKSLIEMRERHQDRQRIEQHARQREALDRRHARERQDFQRHFRALDKLETRERRSLETALRREEFARIARGGPEPPEPPSSPDPTPAPRAPDPITPQFRDAAAPPAPPDPGRTGGGLSPTFNESALGKERDPIRDASQGRGGGQSIDPEPTPPSLSEEFERALKDRAAKRRKEKEQERDRGKGRGPGRDRDR